MKRADARVLLGIGSVLFAGAVALLLLVAFSLHSGRLDARPRHAPRPDHEWILASQEPLWFYGIIALLTAISGYLLVLSWRMMRDALSEGNPR